MPFSSKPALQEDSLSRYWQLYLFIFSGQNPYHPWLLFFLISHNKLWHFTFKIYLESDYISDNFHLHCYPCSSSHHHLFLGLSQYPLALLVSTLALYISHPPTIIFFFLNRVAKLNFFKLNMMSFFFSKQQLCFSFKAKARKQ